MESEFQTIKGKILSVPAPVERALAVLESAGYEAYPVGGCVRDALLGKTPSDWDIATVAEPTGVMEAFSGFRVIETGLKHGTVTVLIDGMSLEITTYRVDGEYTDHRRPDGVIFTRSLTEDLARRDFTVNAMAYHPQRGIIDPFHGQEDLKNGLLRCVGEADKRFNEDPLRILRGMRFMATYGFRAEHKTDISMRRNRELLRFISAERIRVELEKLLLGRYARQILLAYEEILTFVIPELEPTLGFCQHNHWHDLDVYAHTLKTVSLVPNTPALKWAALLHDSGKPGSLTVGKGGEWHYYNHATLSADIAKAVTERLKFDNRTAETVIYLVKNHSDMPEPTEKSVRRSILRCGAEHYGELLLLQQADSLAMTADTVSPRTERMPLTEEITAAREKSLLRVRNVEQIYRDILSKPHCFSVNELDIGGEDLMRMGFCGADIGRAKEALLWAVADGKTVNERQALKAYIQQNGEKRKTRS